MKTSIKTAILFSFTFLLSCVKGPTNYREFLNKQLNDHYKEEFNLYNNIVIIPRSGCHTCKDYADFYFNENKDRKDFLFRQQEDIAKSRRAKKRNGKTLLRACFYIRQ